MATVEADSSDPDFMEKFKDWFGGGDSTDFILKMLAPSLGVFVLGILFPLIYGVYVSFFYYVQRTEPVFVALYNYQELFKDGDFWDAYWNTVFFTVTTVSLELILGLIIALILNAEFKGRGIVRAAILVPWAVPTIVNARIWEYIFGATIRSPVNDLGNTFGWFAGDTVWTGTATIEINYLEVLAQFVFIFAFAATAYTLYVNITDPRKEDWSTKLSFTRNEYITFGIFILSIIFGFIIPDSVYFGDGALSDTSTDMERLWIVIIVVDVWKATPFMALLILAGLQVIPRDLLNAAEVDGANSWQKFRNVTWPLLLPSLGVALLFRLIDAFRVYDIFAIFSARSVEPITAFAVRAQNGGRYGQSSAVAIFTFLNIIVFTVVIMGLTRRRTNV